jgi:hypothetical protein
MKSIEMVALGLTLNHELRSKKSTTREIVIHNQSNKERTIIIARIEEKFHIDLRIDKIKS